MLKYVDGDIQVFHKGQQSDRHNGCEETGPFGLAQRLVPERTIARRHFRTIKQRQVKPSMFAR